MIRPQTRQATAGSAARNAGPCWRTRKDAWCAGRVGTIGVGRMTDTASPVLRDFFYLDIDRVRSLVAQLREGMPEAVERQTVHHGRGGLKLVEYAYERTQTETRSVHHYIFSLLEE